MPVCYSSTNWQTRQYHQYHAYIKLHFSFNVLTKVASHATFVDALKEKCRTISGYTGCTCFWWPCYWSLWQSNCSENNTDAHPQCVALTHSHFMPVEIGQTKQGSQRTLKFPHSCSTTSGKRGKQMSINFPYPSLWLPLNVSKRTWLAILSLCWLKVSSHWPHMSRLIICYYGNKKRLFS